MNLFGILLFGVSSILAVVCYRYVAQPWTLAIFL